MKTLIVDDHALVLRGLALLVASCFPDSAVEEACSYDEAVESLDREPADIALVDVRLPGKDGLDLLAEVRRRWPEIPVVMLTSYDNAQYVRRALVEGAAGYMLKDASPEDLEQAIKVALAGGGNVLSPRAVQNLFDQRGGDEENSEVAEANLTEREVEILGELAQGRSNRDISRALYLSEKTVKAHLATVFRKLGVTNRTQAAMAAVRMGLGPDSIPRVDQGAVRDAAG